MKKLVKESLLNYRLYEKMEIDTLIIKVRKG